MATQSVSSFAIIPHDLKVAVISFLNIPSVLTVSQLSKYFYKSAQEKRIWKSLAERINAPITCFDEDSTTPPKEVFIKQITNRISAFLFIEKKYFGYIDNSFILNRTLLKYQLMLVMIANNLEFYNSVLHEDDLEWDPTHLDSFIEILSHSAILLPRSDKTQLTKKTQNPSLIEI